MWVINIKKIILGGIILFSVTKNAFADDYTNHYLDTLKKETIEGNQTSQKKLEQIKQLTVKASAGDLNAQYQLGMIYKNEGVFINDWLIKVAEKKDPKAQYEVGSVYIDSYHNTADDSVCIDKGSVKDGLKLLSQSAEQGYAPAQYRLSIALQVKKWSVCYKSGTSMENLGNYNLDQSKMWLLKAVAQNYMPAKVELGTWYLKGYNGYPKDINKALSLYQEAMKQNDADGFFAMAKCYQEGIEVPKDLNKAMSLYEQAAKQGSFRALQAISIIYSNQGEDKKSREYGKKSCDLRAKTHYRLWGC